MKASSLAGGLPVPFRLAGVAHQFVDGGDGDVALLVAEDHGAEHDFFGQLVGFGLHHQHGGFGAGDDQVELAMSSSCVLPGLSTYSPLM